MFFSESEAVAAFNKLIHQDRVSIILGVWTSHVARSVFPIVQEDGVVAFSRVVIATGLIVCTPVFTRRSDSKRTRRDDGYPTILGNFSFDENGEALYDPIVLIVKDGELQFLE